MDDHPDTVLRAKCSTIIVVYTRRIYLGPTAHFGVFNCGDVRSFGWKHSDHGKEGIFYSCTGRCYAERLDHHERTLSVRLWRLACLASLPASS